MNFVVGDAIYGLGGGLLIGCAAALFLLGSGRIAGISGLLGGLLRRAPDWPQNAAFLAGLIGAPLLYAALGGAPAIGITRDPALLVAAGLLVGAGTRLGSGCTSGHGVCGISRLSPRSIVATGTFMALGIGVATLLRPLVEIAS